MDLENIFSYIFKKKIIYIIILYVLTYTFLLDKYPLVVTDEAWFSAMASNFAHTGVWGNPLFQGLNGLDVHDYDAMPPFILLLALSFKVFGLGVIQAKMVSVCLGLITVFFTYLIAKKLYNENTGLTAALALASTPVFFIVSRTARYESCVAAFTVIAVYLFIISKEKNKWFLYLLTGVFGGLAFLSHINYGYFVIVSIILVMFFENRFNMFFKASLYYIIAGAIIAILPYALFILSDYSAFATQMSMYSARFSVFNINFWLSNLYGEKERYLYLSVLMSVFAWLAGIVYSLRNIKQNKIILTVSIVYILGLAFLNVNKYNGYLAPATPFLSIAIALLVNDIFMKTGLFEVVKSKISGSAIKNYIVNFKPTPANIIGVLVVCNVIAQALCLSYIVYDYRNSDYNAFENKIGSVLKPGDVILGEPVYWFGLADHTYLATYRYAYLMSVQNNTAIGDELGYNFSEAVDKSNVSIIIDDDFFRWEMTTVNVLPAGQVEDFLKNNATMILHFNDTFYGYRYGDKSKEVYIYRVNNRTNA